MWSRVIRQYELVKRANISVIWKAGELEGMGEERARANIPVAVVDQV